MTKINVKTTRKVICEIHYSKSTLSPEQIKDFVKNNLIHDYDEIHTDRVESIIRFIKYTHNFIAEV